MGFKLFDLCLFDCLARLLVPQIKYSSIYDTFPLFKKRIFHHYFRAFERFLLDPLAEVGYVSRITVLHLCCNLADIQNEELHKNDCWIASKKLEVKGRDRPMVTIEYVQSFLRFCITFLAQKRVQSLLLSVYWAKCDMGFRLSRTLVLRRVICVD